MKTRLRFPLFAKVLVWLILHLVILGLTFLAFVHWQLGLGLDSLLSGAAGDRLAAFGDETSRRIQDKRPHEWNQAISILARERNVTALIFDAPGDAEFQKPLPPDLIQRARSSLQPTGLGAGQREKHPPMPKKPGLRPPPHIPNELQETPEDARIKSRPTFLMRGDDGAYWAGVLLHLPTQRGRPMHPILLLIRSERLDGSGMFFDFKPWLLGGLAVLLLSAAFWTPFIWNISRYLRRLTKATSEISAGNFQVSLPDRGGDELGEVGRSIETMAARIDHLVLGQKRFLSDAAHELCAPLARIRTALGILENQLGDKPPALLATIDSDTAELANLVDEILAFSRAGNRKPMMQNVDLASFIRETVERESAVLKTEIVVPDGLQLSTDPRLLGRAIGNLVRNATIHAGPGSTVRIEAEETADKVVIHVTDNGPGVPASETARIFEPFHRLDPARGRETGGSGLGLAIVRSAIAACGGEVAASLPESGGLRISIRLSKII